MLFRSVSQSRYQRSANEYYDYLVAKRYVYIPDIGYFIIAEKPKEIDDGISKIKEITAYSLEYQLCTKYINEFKGTYKFYGGVDYTSESLMSIILRKLPGWSIGTIDSELISLYRTFDISSSTVYNFLMNDVEEAYQCIFDFDYLNQKINAYTVSGAVSNTDIFINHDNIIKEIQVTEIDDELVTALSVYRDWETDRKSVV